MEILGEGSYGCVVRPTIPCSTKQKTIAEGDTAVGKLFVEEEEFKKEVKAAKNVAKIDASGKTILVPTQYCKTTLGAVSKTAAAWGCESIQDLQYMPPKTPVYQLMMPYGGTRLDYFVKTQKITQKQFVEIMIPVVKGAVMLTQKKYCHQDIKASNILVRPDGLAMLIDYSLMRKFKDIYALDNVRRLKHTYYSYPPEFKVMYGVQTNMSDDDIYSEVVKNANHYRTSYGDVLVSQWGQQNIREFIANVRAMPSAERIFAKLADRIDVYSIGTVFIHMNEYLSAKGSSSTFKRLYNDVIGLMVQLDPRQRITPSGLLERMDMLKTI